MMQSCRRITARNRMPSNFKGATCSSWAIARQRKITNGNVDGLDTNHPGTCLELISENV
jgi:hypothetical protein